MPNRISCSDASLTSETWSFKRTSNPEPKNYEAALEEEIKKWHGFWRALRKNDREAFEAMMDTGRSFVEAGNRAPERPTFEPIMLSILTTLRKQITQLNGDVFKKLAKRRWFKRSRSAVVDVRMKALEQEDFLARASERDTK